MTVLERIGGSVDWWIGGSVDWWIGGLVDWWIGGLVDGGLGDWWMVDWGIRGLLSRRGETSIAQGFSLG
jgi:hypothetical protein